MSTNRYLTVQALTKYIKKKFDLDPHLRNVYVKGELSNVNYHTSGHIFLTLKDEKTSIDGMIAKWDAQHIKFKLERGMSVFIIGEVSVYEQQGRYRLYVKKVEADGIGSLHLAYEQLKEKLLKEGLFLEENKKPLPKFPTAIGVITAQTGAVIQDIYTTINRRFPLAKLILFPVAVQGENAVPTIVQAIELANKIKIVDLLIVGRGGGSIEDLWAFNDEKVARSIFSSTIPIISAVGHETDYTIADFVSDQRAATPTAAAEIAVPAKEDLMAGLLNRQQALYRSFSYKIKYEKEKLHNLQNAYPLQYPERLYRPFIENFVQLQERLNRSIVLNKENKKQLFLRLTNQLHQFSPAKKIETSEMAHELLAQRLHGTINYEKQKRKNHLASLIRLLTTLNPLHVIERGYSIVYDQDEIRKSVKEMKVGDRIQVKMIDGTIKAQIEAIEQGEK